MVEDDIPSSVREATGIDSEHPYRVDLLWAYLKDVKKPGTREYEIDLIFKVAEAVMTIYLTQMLERRESSHLIRTKHLVEAC